MVKTTHYFHLGLCVENVNCEEMSSNVEVEQKEEKETRGKRNARTYAEATRSNFSKEVKDRQSVRVYRRSNLHRIK